MTAAVPAAAGTAAVLVAAVLYAEKAGRPVLRAVAKAGASAVFVAVGFLRWRAGDPYGSWIVAGLLLGAAGDLLLALPRGFAAGLAVFLLGHAAYIAAFAAVVPFAAWPPAALLPVLLVSGVAVRYLWPHLGRLRPAVLVYVAVITVMVWGAAAALNAGPEGWRRLAGAALFYLSDLFVARNRFVRQRFSNRAIGLPLYYAGQLLLAFTVGCGPV